MQNPIDELMSDDAPRTGSYFERIGVHRYRPTEHAGGAWSPHEIHFSPLGGLIVHAIEHHRAQRPGGQMLLSRIGFDILGFLLAEDCDVVVETIRPGRTIELVEATALISGRPVVRARAWFLHAFDTTAIAGGEPGPLTPPEAAMPWPLTSVWSGGFVGSLDARAISAPMPGRATVWLSTATTLVAGEPISPLASWIALVDTANGIAVRQSPKRWAFPNVDLTIQLHRRPEGRWTGLDTTVVFGSTGQGVTSTVLHDLAGPVGYAQQTLTVRPLEL